MSESNGTTIVTPGGNGNKRKMPDTLQGLRESIERKMLENLWSEWDGFGGSDMFDRLRNRDQSDMGWTPLSVPSDRRRGQNWPLWRTIQDLDFLRNQSRMAVTPANAYGCCLMKNLTNSVIGKGFSYKIQSKKKHKPDPDAQGQQPDQLQGLIEQTQDVVDDFLSRNRWNAVANPSEDVNPNGTREREAYMRTVSEGDCFVRLFYLDDEADAKNYGKTTVRFYDPELCRLQPPNETEQDGWTLGMQHAMYPVEDVEQILAYYFVFAVPEQHDQKGHHEGEKVCADEIVHIKQVGTHASTKRGLPAFIWDTLDALTRASKLQKCISISSAVRAATAEIWQHATSTQGQVTGLAAGLADFQRQDPVTGKTQNIDRVIPGMRRRIPAGQTLVPPPASAGVNEHLAAAQGDLRQASAAFCAPEYMTGDASNNNLASSKEAGTPFVRAGESDQEHFKGAFAAVVWRAIKWAVKCGRLDARALTLLDLQVEAPTVATTDPLAMAQVNQIKNLAKVLSVQTWQQQDGLDPEIEQANMEEYQGRMGTGTPLPGMGDDPFGGGDPRNPAPPPVPKPRLAATGEGLEPDPNATLVQLLEAIQRNTAPKPPDPPPAPPHEKTHAELVAEFEAML